MRRKLLISCLANSKSDHRKYMEVCKSPDSQRVGHDPEMCVCVWVCVFKFVLQGLLMPPRFGHRLKELTFQTLKTCLRKREIIC